MHLYVPRGGEGLGARSQGVECGLSERAQYSGEGGFRQSADHGC